MSPGDRQVWTAEGYSGEELGPGLVPCCLGYRRSWVQDKRHALHSALEKNTAPLSWSFTVTTTQTLDAFSSRPLCSLLSACAHRDACPRACPACGARELTHTGLDQSRVLSTSRIGLRASEPRETHRTSGAQTAPERGKGEVGIMPVTLTLAFLDLTALN